MSAGYLRDAVLCMLRRTSGINVASLSAYLSSFFPEIPESCRVPIIVAAFTAAQKVAATHVDVILNADQDRVVWAKKSLARWTHGFSAVEPVFAERDVQKRCSRETSKLSDDRSAYSPTTYFMLTRELPVSVESRFGQKQMKVDFGALQKTQVVVSQEMQAVVPQRQKSLADQAVHSFTSEQQLILTEQVVHPSIETIDSDVEPEDQPEVQGEAVDGSSDGMAEVPTTVSLLPPPEEILVVPDEEEGQLPAETRELRQSNSVFGPVWLKAGVEGLESLVEQFDCGQYGTAQTLEDKGTGVADVIAEPEDMSFTDLQKLPNTETVMFAELSRPLVLLSPLRSPPAPLLSEKEKESPTKLDTRKSGQGQAIRKKKTAVTLTPSATVDKIKSSSDAQSEVVINQAESGNAKENLKRPKMKNDQPSERSPKRAKVTQRMEKSPKHKPMISVLKSKKVRRIHDSSEASRNSTSFRDPSRD